MTTWNGFDISNYTSPLTAGQLSYLKANMAWGMIGLQDAKKARAFQAQLNFLPLLYYIDVPGRDLTIPAKGSIIAIDIEPGCFVRESDVDSSLASLIRLGFRPIIYGNSVSIQPVIGNSTKYANLPLMVADYRTPNFDTFRPFNGWTRPYIWQYDSGGVAGINCDLSLMEESVANLTVDGSQRIVSEGNFIVTYNNNIPVTRIGSTDGNFPGRMSKNFGGNWLWFRTLDDNGNLVAPYWSATEGD